MENTTCLSIVRGPSPCLGCQNRRAACHGSCASFADWKRGVEDVKVKRKAMEGRMYSPTKWK